MVAKKTQSQTNKDTQDNAELVAFRLELVEKALNILTTRFDNQDNIKKSDLKEMIDTIAGRLSDVKYDLQKQIDNKADAQDLKDFKKQMAGIGTLVAALLVATYSFILTRLH